MPDYRPCEEALGRLENEPPPIGAPVDLGVSQSPLRIMIVFGVGADCVKNFLNFQMTVADHLDRFGHEVGILQVESLSSSACNADIIREAPEPGKTVVGLKNHGVTITGESLEEIFERTGGKLVQPVPMS